MCLFHDKGVERFAMRRLAYTFCLGFWKKKKNEKKIYMVLVEKNSESVFQQWLTAVLTMLG